MVIDQLIRKLKGPVGLELDGSRLAICLSTVQKSFTISILADSKSKKTKVDGATPFFINNEPLKILKVNDSFKYLGVNFSAKGLLAENCYPTLHDYLAKLKSAPLKPQQRIWILKNTLLPKLLHLLVLSSVTAGKLAKLDSITRAFVRGALFLPGDCPNSFIHASVADGGLGVLSFRVSVPLWRRSSPGGKNYTTLDGAALIGSSKVKNQNLWVQSRNKFLSGKDYVNLLKTKIACLPTAARCARGRPAKDKYCRAGCPRKETLNHVSQACPRTYGKRIQRHEAVVNYLKRACENRGFEVTAEPLYKTSVGNRKPDLLAKKNGKILVIDAQVVGDAVDLERANNTKIYYRDNVELDQQIQAQHGSPDISYLGATLNLRGVWSAKSVFDLVDKFKVLSRTDVPVVSTRVLIGTFASFTMFNRSTARAMRGKHS
ncbi:Retrovirus-related Pol polyprotein from type-2 retrotransposable element R2DM [Araneus ventricosus]|uniref:Retrovirus-related Pol polyprotein from type-2 retrotransposable element R2DM n=1 Tax=Araneus ventricosus TaxID=182803 RepID=A0A4Y2T3N4_ARAVE|nr:Retrovirus-related Pol polyprotein from type-2 retrotransposable element R2DM [Araneus ventricosus]